MAQETNILTVSCQLAQLAFVGARSGNQQRCLAVLPEDRNEGLEPFQLLEAPGEEEIRLPSIEAGDAVNCGVRGVPDRDEMRKTRDWQAESTLMVRISAETAGGDKRVHVCGHLVQEARIPPPLGWPSIG